MTDLTTEFEAAAQAVQKLPRRPDNTTLLKLYGLYKQGAKGDASGRRPGFTDFLGRAKYDAWMALKGTPQDTAMRDYIALVETLQRAAR